jgi:Tol biopolymer transport system component
MVWEPPGRFSVAVVDADGGEEESVVERGWPCAGPTWSPDGESVAYIAMERFRTHAIWIARVDGADDRELMPAATDVYDLDWWGPELLDVGARGKRPFTWGWLKQLHTAPLGGR